MKKRVIRGMVAASVSAAIIGSCIFMTSTNGHGSVDVNAASVPSVTAESKTEIPLEYPSEAVYLHNRADIQKQKAGQEAWKKAQAEKKAAEEKKKADDELAAKEKAANDAMQAVWDFPNGCLKDGATRDMLADAQAKIEALPDGNATKDALSPAIVAADNAFTVIENQQKAAEEQSQQTQQTQAQTQQTPQQDAEAVSYNTVPATSFGVQDCFDQSYIDALSPALQSVAWNIVSACENNQSGLVYVGSVDQNEDWYQLDNFGAVWKYFGIDDGYSLCSKNSDCNFDVNPDGTVDLYILGGDTAYNAIQAKRNRVVYYQQLLGNVPTDDAGKVAAINARICNLLNYDWSYTIHDPDTAVNAGTGVCEAYAKLFHRMAESVGLQDQLCVGPANGGLHEWNQTLVNGQWLYTDSTWNDCAGQDLYYLSPTLWSDHGFEYYDYDLM